MSDPLGLHTLRNVIATKETKEKAGGIKNIQRICI